MNEKAKIEVKRKEISMNCETETETEKERNDGRAKGILNSGRKRGLRCTETWMCKGQKHTISAAIRKDYLAVDLLGKYMCIRWKDRHRNWPTKSIKIFVTFPVYPVSACIVVEYCNVKESEIFCIWESCEIIVELRMSEWIKIPSGITRIMYGHDMNLWFFAMKQTEDEKGLKRDTYSLYRLDGANSALIMRDIPKDVYSQFPRKRSLALKVTFDEKTKRGVNYVLMQKEDSDRVHVLCQEATWTRSERYEGDRIRWRDTGIESVEIVLNHVDLQLLYDFM